MVNGAWALESTLGKFLNFSEFHFFLLIYNGRHYYHFKFAEIAKGKWLNLLYCAKDWALFYAL